MSIRVQLTPPLWKYVPGYDPNAGIVLENADGWNVHRIIKELKIPPDEVFAVMVNAYPGTPQSVVKDGDFITLSKVIGGG